MVLFSTVYSSTSYTTRRQFLNSFVENIWKPADISLWNVSVYKLFNVVVKKAMEQ